MSERFKVGDRVLLEDSAGYNVAGWIEPEMNDPKYGWMYCLLNCGDDSCVEWPNIKMPDGSYRFHVSECQMKKAKP
jgi:hypothetical protein